MAITDRYGFALATSSEQAGAHYRRGVDCLLAGGIDAKAAFADAVAADNDLAVAHAALALTLATTGSGGRAREAMAVAASKCGRVSEREVSQVRALGAVLNGSGRARALLDGHLVAHPRDAVVLFARLILQPLAWGGQDLRRTNLRLCATLRPVYGNDWWYLGAASFAHLEVGLFAEALALAERSLSANSGNAGAAHSLAHLYQDSGSAADGIAFLCCWLDANGLRCAARSHLNWHLALIHLRLDQAEQARAVYDRAIGPDGEVAPTTLMDGAALLWRLRLAGMVDLPWSHLVKLANLVGRSSPVPALLGAALAYSGAGDHQALRQLEDQLTTRRPTGATGLHEAVCAQVRGLRELARGHLVQATDAMGDSLKVLRRLGMAGGHLGVLEEISPGATPGAGRLRSASLSPRPRRGGHPRPSGVLRARWKQSNSHPLCKGPPSAPGEAIPRL